MSMRIQDAFSNCCESIKEFAASAAVYIAKTGSELYATATETMSKVAEVVKPHFETLKTFVQQHRVPILIATIAFGIGAALAAIITTVFCRETGASQASSNSAVTV